MLTEDEKIGIVSNRIKQFEGEYFNHELNLAGIKNLSSPGEAQTAQLAQIQEAQDTIEAAIDLAKEELVKLQAAK